MLGSFNKPLKGRTVIILLLITNAIYLLMLLWSIPELQNRAGGIRVPEMMPLGYDRLYMLKFFFALGREGQDFYLFRQIPLDMLFPFFYGITYSVLIIWLFARFAAMESPWVNLWIVPLIAALFDYLENMAILLLMAEYPDISSTTTSISSILTMVKSGLIALYVVALVLSVIYFLFIKRLLFK